MPVVVSMSDLKAFASVCYQAMQVPPSCAEVMADSLVQADLWGHQSHGVMRLFWYGLRIASGAIDPRFVPRTVEQPPALSAVDGQNGLGQVVAQAAMETAIRAARQHGIGAVSVRRGGHLGTAMYFTRQAAKAGCIGFLSTNASPAMAPWGGIEKRVGNNPWSWAAPAGHHPPMMLDLANTVVARGKLYLARQRGEAIPPGWAIDADGNATTDPSAGIAGTILPMAGHKGYAISTLMDVLSGVLSGSAFGSSVVGPYMPEGESGVGHLIIAIDISHIRPLEDFEHDMAALIRQLKSTPRAPSVDEIYYPGELEARSEALARDQGISLPDTTVNDLRTGANKLGVKAPF